MDGELDICRCWERAEGCAPRNVQKLWCCQCKSQSSLAHCSEIRCNRLWLTARAAPKPEGGRKWRVHEFGNQNGADFLVTEYIAGMPLNDQLAASALPAKQVIVDALLLSLCIGAIACGKPHQQQQEQSMRQQQAQLQQQQGQQQDQSQQQQPQQEQSAPHQQVSAKDTAELRRAIDAGTLEDLPWPIFQAYKSEAVKFYESLGNRLAWIANSQPTPQARQMIQILQGAEEQGVDPEDYDASRWHQRLEAFGGSNTPDETEQVHFDLALTISAMRYLTDVSRGRMNPETFGFELYVKRKPIAPQTSGQAVGQNRSHLGDFIREQVIDTTDLHSVIATIEPQFPEYQRAEQALKKYLELAKNESGNSAATGKPGARRGGLPSIRRTLKPGAAYSGVTQLVQRLAELGEISDDAAKNMSGPKYDGAIVAAIKNFQKHHGIQANGAIGPQVLRELNAPISWRVMQIQATLERWRWLPREMSPPLILVNIPGYSLETLDDNFQRALSMQVVVGGAYEHKTPEMVSQIKTVVFRPSWNVPLKIQQKELVPKIASKPSYLKDNDFEIVDSAGKPVHLERVVARTIKKRRSGTLKLRQKPGPENATGLIKFEFPNREDVYLHGTPQTKVFAKTARDLSHGCVRVDDPVSLAVWVLRSEQGWDVNRVNAAIGGDKTDRINLDMPVSVLIIYATAMAGDDGAMYFFPDVYGYDADFKRMLAYGYPHLHEAKPPEDLGQGRSSQRSLF
jgi:L,D-transpeptidase YcbB